MISYQEFFAFRKEVINNLLAYIASITEDKIDIKEIQFFDTCNGWPDEVELNPRMVIKFQKEKRGYPSEAWYDFKKEKMWIDDWVPYPKFKEVSKFMIR